VFLDITEITFRGNPFVKGSADYFHFSHSS
jgi:hypothetical protein